MDAHQEREGVKEDRIMTNEEKLLVKYEGWARAWEEAHPDILNPWREPAFLEELEKVGRVWEGCEGLLMERDVEGKIGPIPEQARAFAALSGETQDQMIVFIERLLCTS